MWKRYVETRGGGGVKYPKAERTARAESWWLEEVRGGFETGSSSVDRSLKVAPAGRVQTLGEGLWTLLHIPDSMPGGTGNP